MHVWAKMALSAFLVAILLMSATSCVTVYESEEDEFNAKRGGGAQGESYDISLLDLIR